MSNKLKDLCSRDRYERSLKMSDILAIHFILSETRYDIEGSTNDFTVYLNLNGSTTSSSKNKSKAGEGSDAEEDTKAKDSKIHQKVQKLCKGGAKAYIFWMK